MKPTVRLVVEDNGSLWDIVPGLGTDILTDFATITDRYGNCLVISASVAMAAFCANACARKFNTVTEYITTLCEENEKQHQKQEVAQQANIQTSEPPKEVTS